MLEAGRDSKAGVSKAAVHPTTRQGGGRAPTQARTISKFLGAVGEVSLPSLAAARRRWKRPHTPVRAAAAYASRFFETRPKLPRVRLASRRFLPFLGPCVSLFARFPAPMLPVSERPSATRRATSGRHR